MNARALHHPGLAWRVPEVFGRRDRSPLGPIDRDLPALVDPLTTLPLATRILATGAVVLVMFTAGRQVGSGFSPADVAALVIAYAIATAVSTTSRIVPFDGRRIAIVLAVQLLFVVSLTTMTGGGDSAYVALYAPILALAGWHLRLAALALTISLIVGLEAWRAMTVQLGGGIDTLLISLPIYAALAVLASVTARHLAAALLTIRRDQSRTAATLAAVQGLIADPAGDPLEELSMAVERVFGAEATIVAIPPSLERYGDAIRSEDECSIVAPITGTSETYAVVHALRKVPFGTNERRLIAILAGVTGRTMDSHPSGLPHRVAAGALRSAHGS